MAESTKRAAMFPTDIQIIIAEDSDASRTFIREILSDLGYKNVVESCDGMEAFEKLEALKQAGKDVDLIISDWNMPRQSGLDLLVRIRSMTEFNTIPFLMTTVDKDLSLITLAISSGADEFVSKPVTKESIETKMKSIWTQLQKASESP